jgi:FKBP12-rapamycin complex-associated protein
MILSNGTIAHIDFGDCFEVAMNRKKYPEAVPFRLTRLLVKALGVIGVDGTFRQTSEHVMKLVRRNRDSLLSVLETFVYDPLLNRQLRAVKAETDGEVNAWRELGNRIEMHAFKPAAVKADPDPGVEDAMITIRQAVTAMDVDAAVALFSAAKEHMSEELGARLTHDLRSYIASQTYDDKDAVLARIQTKLLGTDFPTDPSEAPRAQPPGQLPSAKSFDDDFGDLQQHEFGDVIFQHESVGNSLRWGPSNPRHEASSSHQHAELPPVHQVQRLIQAATSLENLAEAYLTGWAPFL